MWAVFNRDSFTEDLKSKWMSMKSITSKRKAISFLTGLPEETIRKILCGMEPQDTEKDENDAGSPREENNRPVTEQPCKSTKNYKVSPSEYGKLSRL